MDATPNSTSTAPDIQAKLGDAVFAAIEERCYHACYNALVDSGLLGQPEADALAEEPDLPEAAAISPARFVHLQGLAIELGRRSDEHTLEHALGLTGAEGILLGLFLGQALGSFATNRALTLRALTEVWKP